MTTIKLIPQAMEFDVSLDSASMPSLFNQSIETTIIQEVDRQVCGRIPTVSSIAESVTESIRVDRDFCRKIRDWVMESIDYDSITTDVRENLQYDEVASYLLDNDGLTDILARAIVQNTRFKSNMNAAVNLYLESLDIQTRVDDKIAEMSSLMENRIIESVLNTIAQRLAAKFDV